jgi:hypothetical protein
VINTDAILNLGENDLPWEMEIDLGAWENLIGGISTDLGLEEKIRIVCQLNLLIECESLSPEYLEYVKSKIGYLCDNYPNLDTQEFDGLCKNIFLKIEHNNVFIDEKKIKKIKEILSSVLYILAENDSYFDVVDISLSSIESYETQILYLGVVSLLNNLRGDNLLNYLSILEELSVFLYFDSNFENNVIYFSEKKTGLYEESSLTKRAFTFLEKKLNISFPKVNGEQIIQLVDAQSKAIIKETTSKIATSVISMKINEELDAESSLCRTFDFVEEEEVLGIFDDSNRLIEVFSFSAKESNPGYLADQRYNKKTIIQRRIVKLKPNSSQLIISVNKGKKECLEQIVDNFRLEENSNFEYELSHVILPPVSGGEGGASYRKGSNGQWQFLLLNGEENFNFEEVTLFYKKCQRDLSKGIKRKIEKPIDSGNQVLEKRNPSIDSFTQKICSDCVVVFQANQGSSYLIEQDFPLHPLESIWVRYPIPKVEDFGLPSEIGSCYGRTSSTQEEGVDELNLLSVLWNRELSEHGAKIPHEFMQMMLNEDLLRKGASLKVAAQVMGGAWVENSRMYKGEGDLEYLVSLEGEYPSNALSYISDILEFMLHPSLNLTDKEKDNYKTTQSLIQEAIRLNARLETSNYQTYFKNKQSLVTELGLMNVGEKRLIASGMQGSNEDLDVGMSGHSMYTLVECVDSNNYSISIYNRGYSSNSYYSLSSNEHKGLVPSKVKVEGFTREEISDISLWGALLDQSYLADMEMPIDRVFFDEKKDSDPVGKFKYNSDLSWLYLYINSLGKKVTYCNWLTSQKSGNCVFKSIFAFINDQDPNNYFLFSTLIRQVTLAIQQENISRGVYSKNNLAVAFKMGKCALEQLTKRLIKADDRGIPSNQQSIIRLLHYRLFYIYNSQFSKYTEDKSISFDLSLEAKGVSIKFKVKDLDKKINSKKIVINHAGYNAYLSWRDKNTQHLLLNTPYLKDDRPDEFESFVIDLMRKMESFERENSDYFSSVASDEDLGLYLKISQIFIRPLPLDLFVNIEKCDEFFSYQSDVNIRRFHLLLGEVAAIFLKEERSAEEAGIARRLANKEFEHEIVLDLWKLYYVQLCVSHYYSKTEDETSNEKFFLEGRETDSLENKFSCDWSLLKFLPDIFKISAPIGGYQNTLDLLRKGFSRLVPSGEFNFRDKYNEQGQQGETVRNIAEKTSAFDFEYCSEYEDEFVLGLKKSRYYSFLEKHYTNKSAKKINRLRAYFHFGRMLPFQRSSRSNNMSVSYIALGEAHYAAGQFTLNYLRGLNKIKGKTAATSFQDKEAFLKSSSVTELTREVVGGQLISKNELKFDSSQLRSYNERGLSNFPRKIESFFDTKHYPLLLEAIREGLPNSKKNNLLLEFLKRCYQGESLSNFFKESPLFRTQLTEFITDELNSSIPSLELNKKIDVERVLILSTIGSKLLLILKGSQTSNNDVQLLEERLSSSLNQLIDNYERYLSIGDVSIDAKVLLQSVVFLFLSGEQNLNLVLEDKTKVLSLFTFLKSKNYLSRHLERDKKAFYLNSLAASGIFSSEGFLEKELSGFPKRVVLFFASYFDNKYLEIIKEMEENENLLRLFLTKAYPLRQGRLTEGLEILILEDEDREKISQIFKGVTSKKNCPNLKKVPERLEHFCSSPKYENSVFTDVQGVKCAWMYDSDIKSFQLISSKLFVTIDLEKMLFQSNDVELSDLGNSAQELCVKILGNQNLSELSTLENEVDYFYFKKGNSLAKKVCSIFVNFLAVGSETYLLYDCPADQNPLKRECRYIVVDSRKGVLEDKNASEHFTFKVSGEETYLSGRHSLENDVGNKGLIDFSPIYFDGKHLRHFDRPSLILYNKTSVPVEGIEFLKRLIGNPLSAFIWINEVNGQIDQIDLPLKSFLEQESLSLININGCLALNLYPNYTITENQCVKGLPYTENHLLFENQNKKLLVVFPLVSAKGEKDLKFFEDKHRYFNSFGEIDSTSEEKTDFCFLYKIDSSGNLFGDTFSEQVYLLYLYCLNENFSKATQELSNLRIPTESKDITLFDKKIIKSIREFYPRSSPQVEFVVLFNNKLGKIPGRFLGKTELHLNSLDEGFYRRINLKQEEIADKVNLKYCRKSLLKIRLQLRSMLKRDSSEFILKNNIDLLKSINLMLVNGYEEVSICNSSSLVLYHGGISIISYRHEECEEQTGRSVFLPFFIEVARLLKSDLSVEDYQKIKNFIFSANILYSDCNKEKSIANYYLMVLKLMIVSIDRGVKLPNGFSYLDKSKEVLKGYNDSYNYEKTQLLTLGEIFFVYLEDFVFMSKKLLLSSPGDNISFEEESCKLHVERKEKLKENYFIKRGQLNKPFIHNLEDIQNVISPTDLNNRLVIKKRNSLDLNALNNLRNEVVKLRDSFCRKFVKSMLVHKIRLDKNFMLLYLSQKAGYLSLVKDITMEYLKFGGVKVFRDLDPSEGSVCEGLLLNYNICCWYTSHLEALSGAYTASFLGFETEKSKTLIFEDNFFIKENLLEKRATSSQLEFFRRMFSSDKIVGLLSMGAGKTTFLTPMIVHKLLFKEESKGVCVVLPNPSVYPILIHELWKMGIDCIQYEFNRQSCTAESLNKLTTIYKNAIDNNKVLIVSEKSLQTVLSMSKERIELARCISVGFKDLFRKKYTELVSPKQESFEDFLKRTNLDKPLINFSIDQSKFQSILGNSSDFKGVYSAYSAHKKRYIGAINEHYLALNLEKIVTSVATCIDEVDMYGVNKSHNFPVGKESSFSQIYFDCIVDLYFKILPKTQFFGNIQRNQQTAFSDDDVKVGLLPTLSGQLLLEIPGFCLSGLDIEETLTYLCGSLEPSSIEVQSKVYDIISGWIEEGDDKEKVILAKKLKIYRDLLVTYLPSVLKRNVFADYAPSYEKEDSLICIPQIANGKAKEGSQFKDFIYTSMQTCQFYLQDFNREAVYLGFLKFLSEEEFSREEIDFTLGFFDIDSLDKLIDDSWVLSNSERLREKIQNGLASNNKRLINLIGEFLKTRVLSLEVKSSDRKISTYLGELINSLDVMKGFSGTLSEEHNIPCEIIDVDNSYEKTSSACKKQGEVFVESFDTPSEFINAIRNVCLKKGESLGNIRAIIDVSPFFKGMTPQEVVNFLKVEFFKEKENFITYGEKQGQEHVCNSKQGRSDSIVIRSEIQDYMELVTKSEHRFDDVVVFHDHLHIRAGNIWLPDGSIGVVTFDNTVSYHDLLQGACRMRKLTSGGHKVWFFITTELSIEIRTFLGIADDDEITITDILDFAKGKTEEKEKELYFQGKLLHLESTYKRFFLNIMNSFNLVKKMELYSSKGFYKVLTNSIKLDAVSKMGLVYKKQDCNDVVNKRVGRYLSVIPNGSVLNNRLNSTFRPVLDKAVPFPDFVTNTTNIEGSCELQVEKHQQDQLQFDDPFANFSNYQLEDPYYFHENPFLITSEELETQLMNNVFLGESVESLPIVLSTNTQTNSFGGIFSEDIFVTKTQSITFKRQNQASTILTLEEKPISYYLVLRGDTEAPKILIVSLEQYILLEKHYIKTSEMYEKGELPVNYLNGTWLVQADAHVTFGKGMNVEKPFLFDHEGLNSNFKKMLIEILVLSRHWSLLVSPKVKPLLEEWLGSNYKAKTNLISYIFNLHKKETVSKSGLEFKRIVSE